MSDKQRTIVALASTSEACTAALATPPKDSIVTDESLSTVLADIDGLLAIVYNLTTKLSLALKPSDPSYSASIPLLNDLANPIAALTHASHHLSDRIHGATLVKVVRSHLTQIVEALRAQMQTFLNIAARGPQLPGTSASADEYLIRTGALHDLIATARGPTGIPKDNRSAVHISWKSDGESFDDSFQEVTKLIKQAENPTDHPPDDDQDDGWGDIGLGGACKLDSHELARAKNVHSLLRLTTLLHKRVSLDILPYPSSAPVTAFDDLLDLSNQLLSTSDNLVASLYTPQDPLSVREEVLDIADITTSLQSEIVTLLLAVDPLSDQLSALSLDAATTQSTKKRADKKWFDTCVDQILRLCTTVSESTK